MVPALWTMNGAVKWHLRCSIHSSLTGSGRLLNSTKDIHFKKMHGFFDTDQPFTCLGVPFIGLRKKNGVLNVLGFECAVWILMFRI